MSLHPRAVFFDLGDTLGSATLSRSPRRLERFDVYSFVPALLGQLRSDGHRLGIISNTGDDDGAHVDAVLANTGILPLFEPMLRIYSKDVGLKKDSPAIFGLAAQKAQLAPVQCVFVGEDSAERTVAAAAGFTTCPHPLLVREVIAGQVLRYARLSVRREEIDTDWRAALATLPLVPLHVTGTGGRVVYAIVGERAIPDLANRRFRADLLGAPGLPSSTDLYIFRDDAAAESGFLAPQGQAGMLFARGLGHVLLSSTDEGLVVALPPQVGPDDLHFEHTRHGHTLKLMPDPGLLAPLAAPAAPAAFAAPRAQAAPTLPAAVKAAFERIDAAAIADRIARFSGTKPPNDRGAAPIVSRHIAHPDNARAEALLAEELADCGRGRLTVQFHRFTHAGRTLHNVEAELAGATPEVVLVTAHLDSTAASSRPYDAVNDPAPGADDDCSGTAAVLTLAEHFAGLAAAAGPPQRTIRFVLFNAEEHGLIGSDAYAKQQRTRRARIAAVFQMDMIGFNRVGARGWELHAGFIPSEEVEARSAALARLIGACVPLVSPTLEPPQIYTSSSKPEGDPAYGRSDHTSFNWHGIPACCASEDLFVGPGSTPPHEPNPSYHRKEDTFVDAAYAADIARAIAAAVWLTANATETSVRSGM